MKHPFKKLLSFIMFVALITLAACGAGDVGDDVDDELAVLEVDLDVPERADVGETVEFNATVTYGDEVVTDADEVIYEVSQEGDQDNQDEQDDEKANDDDDMFGDDSEKIDATNNEDGTYSAEMTFEEDGVYTVQVHVTARTLHTMPLQDIIVGEGDTDDDSDADEDGVSLQFMEPEDVTVDEQVDLITHLEMDDEPMTSANVTYEIAKKDASDTTETIDAEQTNDGEYAAPFTFSEEGTYEINIYVEDADLDVEEDEQFEVEITS